MLLAKVTGPLEANIASKDDIVEMGSSEGFDNLLQPDLRVGSVYCGTRLLKAKLDLHCFILKEICPFSVGLYKMIPSATSAGNMMEQSG